MFIKGTNVWLKITVPYCCPRLDLWAHSQLGEQLRDHLSMMKREGLIDLPDLPTEIRGDGGTLLAAASSEGATMDQVKARYARLMLHRFGGNKRRTCRTLGITFKTLQTYLQAGDEEDTLTRAVE